MKSAIQSYIMRQYNQILVGGWPVLWRKLQRLVQLPSMLIYFLAFPLVLLIRLISPFVIVRFCTQDFGRIGGAYQSDWYLTLKAGDKHHGRNLDFFIFEKSTEHFNKQWMKMWRRVLPSVPGTEFWRKVFRLNKLFSGYEIHEINLVAFPPSNEHLVSVLKNYKSNISFTEEEENIGKNAIQNLGIPDGHPFICFHARDSAFLKKVNRKKDFSYHNYRDSSIQNHVPAAEEMTKRGNYAVRMGSIVEEPVNCSNPQVIDYATNGQRTDFNDIYIGSHCRFFISSDSGISIIPEIFRIPIVYVNKTSMNIIHTWALNGLFIFKKFFLQKERRYMNFLEIMNLKFGGVDTPEILSRLNLELTENTPDEIWAVTVEMDERLNGTWETTKEDEKLQKRFWALFGLDKLKSPDLRIGADYLRQNKDLLDPINLNLTENLLKL